MTNDIILNIAPKEILDRVPNSWTPNGSTLALAIARSYDIAFSKDWNCSEDTALPNAISNLNININEGYRFNSILSLTFDLKIQLERHLLSQQQHKIMTLRSKNTPCKYDAFLSTHYPQLTTDLINIIGMKILWNIRQGSYLHQSN